jgi:hypothetical protein
MVNKLICSCFLLVAFLTPSVYAQESPFFGQGRWRNDRVGTSGQLTCAIQKLDGNTWNGRFNGEFQREPFSYTIRFQQAGDAFTGRSVIDGYTYTWTGIITQRIFRGRFESLRGNPPRRGNHGTFTLNQTN